jgi:hypothetical protein
MASPIDPTLAASLIKEYQDQNAATGGPALKTPDGPFLNGFFIDRKSLEDILNNNPDAAGISVHIAKDPVAAGKLDNIFTIFFAGASGALPPFDRCSDIYGSNPPCPPWCVK